MPLEIRQISIRMEVADDEPPATEVDRTNHEFAHRRDARDEARLVDRCVEAVLAELSRRAER